MSSSARPDLVGRDHELSRLEARLDDACGGRGRLVLLRGEAGIGKTRLAEEIGERAAARGAKVLRGRCWEGGGAPAFWPWVEVFRDLRGPGRGTAFSSAPEEVIGLAQMVFDAENVPLLSLEGGENGFALLESAVLALKKGSASEPLVLLLEDLHAADHSSLRLLRFLAGELSQSRILVVGTRRDVEAGEPDFCGELLDEVSRAADVLSLGRLSEPDTERIVRGAPPAAVPRRLVAEIHEVTEGNPLFIHELVRLAGSAWETTGSIARIGIPPRLRDVIRRHLESLSTESLETLAVASVIGREFDLASLATASGLPGERVLALLGEATRSGVVVTEPGIGRYRFSHALVRQTLHEDLPPARRAELHGRIAEALESIGAVSESPEVSKLAHHHLEVARAGGDSRKAVEYAIRAAEHALASFAYREAGDHYERALGLHDDGGSAGERSRCALLLALGEARSKGGDAVEAKKSFLAAAAAARRLASLAKDAPALLARAALGLGGVWLVTGIGVVDEVLLDLLEEALEALPEEDGTLRARVLARLAAELRWSDAEDRRAGLSGSAVDMARRLGDASTLAYALIGRYWSLWGPDNLEERLAIAGEVVGLGSAAGDHGLALAGHTWRLAAALEQGDVEAVDRDFDAVLRLAEKTRQPYYRWWSLALQAMRALFAGRLDLGESLAGEALAAGQEVAAQDAAPAYGVQMATLRREQGRLAEMEDSFRAFIAAYPEIPAWRCALARLYAEVGDSSGARSEHERLFAQDLRDVPRDQQWLTVVAIGAEVSVFLEDRRRAALCYDLLLPYAGRNVVLGSASAFYGSVSHFLGLLAGFLSEPAEAARHFEAALAMNAKMGARPFLARTQLEYGCLLLARALPGDRIRGRDLLEEAGTTARTIGMGSLVARLAALTAESETVVESPAFRLEGEYWAIAHGGGVARVRDTKGLRYLEYLVRHPGREIHALDLAAEVESGERVRGSAAGRARRELGAPAHNGSRLGDAGEVIDGRAKEAYRRRLEELREELEQATDQNDLGRSGRLRAEIEVLTGELAGAYGLGGRSRRAGSAADKARVNITKTIQGAIERIGAESPALARHLKKAVRTGTFFSYLGADRSAS